MPQFVRIKNYFFNLENVAYIRVEDHYIEFGFALPIDPSGRPHCIRLEKGTHLQDSEFAQVVDFILQLPDPDRVIVV